MVTSLSELVSELSLQAVPTFWNCQFPFDDIKKAYHGTDKESLVDSFIDIASKRFPIARVNTKDFLDLGLLAETKKLILAYMVTGNNSISLFIQNLVDTREWMSQFRDIVTRRQFFTLIHSCRNTKQYSSLFQFSSFYNLYSPKLPSTCSRVNIHILSKDYILVQYINDYDKPDYIVIKVGELFEYITPVVEYDPSKFLSLTLRVEDKIFVGDSIKTLKDPSTFPVEETNKVIDITYGNTIYSLDPKDGVVWNNWDREELVIPKFRSMKDVGVLASYEHKGMLIILLTNGVIWTLPNNKFVNVNSIKGLESMNLDIFSISSQEKGVYISTEGTIVESVPFSVFIRFVIQSLFR